MARIYLDYNATTPVFAESITAAAAAMAHTGNASSIHGEGRAARKLVEDARSLVGELANVRAAQVIFNAGATEGNNTILSGYADKTILVLATEHPSILEAAPRAIKIPVTKDGLTDRAAYESLLAEHKPALVCIQLVNSETGVVQPVTELAALAREHGAALHCDAVQAAGRMPLDFKSLGVDTMTLSAHKFGGPQGTGALIFREGLQLPKLLHGGGQEKRQRAGTENIAAICGFGAAAQKAAANLAAWQDACAAFQSRLERALRDIAPDIILAGENAPRIHNTTSVLLPGISAETQLMSMDLEGIAVSSGSACSSGTFKPSHVLAAMGYNEADARAALRFSTGWATTDADIDNALAAYARMVSRVLK